MVPKQIRLFRTEFLEVIILISDGIKLLKKAKRQFSQTTFLMPKFILTKAYNKGNVLRDLAVVKLKDAKEKCGEIRDYAKDMPLSVNSIEDEGYKNKMVREAQEISATCDMMDKSLTAVLIDLGCKEFKPKGQITFIPTQPAQRPRANVPSELADNESSIKLRIHQLVNLKERLSALLNK